MEPLTKEKFEKFAEEVRNSPIYRPIRYLTPEEVREIFPKYVPNFPFGNIGFKDPMERSMQ